MNSREPYFSICIPNFNYESYLGVTIDSVLTQSFSDFEIVIADNASTDGSVRLIREYSEDKRVRFKVNSTNVGFSGNLRECSTMARGRYLLMLSSDDLVGPGALDVYSRIYNHIGAEAEHSILSSGTSIIDKEGNVTGHRGVDWKQWAGAEKHTALSEIAGTTVYAIDASKLLRNSLNLLRSPMYFVSTMYPRALFESVGGYVQASHMNPDKRFAWDILAKASKAYFVDRSLFAYRVHDNNQNAKQSRSGALKHLVDQYSATFSLSDEILNNTGIERSTISKRFIEEDIVLRGFTQLAAGNRKMVSRMLSFGKAAYPDICNKNLKFHLLNTALLTGPIGTYFASLFMSSAKRRWHHKLSRESGNASA